jgi:TPR repeat protein
MKPSLPLSEHSFLFVGENIRVVLFDNTPVSYYEGAKLIIPPGTHTVIADFYLRDTAKPVAYTANGLGATFEAKSGAAYEVAATMDMGFQFNDNRKVELIVDSVSFTGEDYLQVEEQLAETKASLDGQGDAKEKYQQARNYSEGFGGVPQDKQKAFELYTQAAEQGNINAQFDLAVMYEEGDGIPKDIKKAVYWYTMAAEKGDAIAQLIVGAIYLAGDRVPQDRKKAKYWLEKAAANGDQQTKADAKELLNMLRH